MTIPVNDVKPVNNVTKSIMQQYLNELAAKPFEIKEDFRERVMLELFAGGSSMDDVREVVKRLYFADGEFIDEEALDSKVYEFWATNRNDLNHSARSIHSQVVDYIESSNGCISLQCCYKDLGLREAGEKTACRMAIKRLTDHDVIEPLTGKVGIYQIVNHDKLEPMRLITTPIIDFPVILPLDLNDMVKIHAKNILLIAGSKSAGKSMMAFWVAVANQNLIPIDYFNSEMGEEEYSDRMQKMGFTSADQIKFNMYPVHNDYHNYITEEKKIFIVDFLEIHDNFFEIAKPIRKIHEKLKDGICIILAQMPVGGKMALGKGFSAEKARLYLTMEYEEEFRSTKVTIYDAKSPKQQDIRGMYRRIKIINGAKISPLDNWHHDFKGGR